jgi:cytochrome b561
MTFGGLIEWAEGHNRRGRYSPIGITFHWTMAAAIVYQLWHGWYLNQHVVSADKYLGYQQHGTVGLTIMAVGALRLFWKSNVAGPHLVDDRTLSGKLSAALQYFFYVCFFALPISGWVMWSTLPGELALSVAGVLPVPNLPFDQLSFDLQARLMHWAVNTHHVFVWALMITIPGHAGAAILHHFVKGDRVLSSMLIDFNGPEVEGLVGSPTSRG